MESNEENPFPPSLRFSYIPVLLKPMVKKNCIATLSCFKEKKMEADSFQWSWWIGSQTTLSNSLANWIVSQLIDSMICLRLAKNRDIIRTWMCARLMARKFTNARVYYWLLTVSYLWIKSGINTLKILIWFRCDLLILIKLINGK